MHTERMEYMNLPLKYELLLSDLREISGPIIQFRIDTEFLGKQERRIEDYIDLYDQRISYWFSGLRKNHIHGRNDTMYENVIAKLLEYGLTKENQQFDEAFRYVFEKKYWEKRLWEPIILYPFLIRAGYSATDPVHTFFMTRLQAIEQTISQKGYDFQEKIPPMQVKYREKFILNTDFQEHPLPSIYDIYAYAFYPKTSDAVSNRIEHIIAYTLDDRFQRIPEEAYVYEKSKNRYYAAGSVYHACLREERKLLNIYLFSHFKSIATHEGLMNDIHALLQQKDHEGFFLFDKTLLKEKKDMCFIYSGAHMGLGENRRKKHSRRIESTFWMLKILSNLHQHNIEV